MTPGLLEAYRRVHELDFPAKAAENDTDVRVMKDEMKEQQIQRHPLIFAAFVLSLIMFVMPSHADLAFSAVIRHKLCDLAVATLLCFGVVLAPLITGSYITRRHPERWRRSRLATTTWVILGLSLVVNGFMWWWTFALFQPLFHDNPSICLLCPFLLSD